MAVASKVTSGLRLGFPDLVSAGGRAISRYTGTLFAVFAAQSLVAAACMLAIAVVLAQTFAHLPMFDEAVDGDLIALIYTLRHGRASVVAIGGIAFGAVMLWQLASWFLAGGLYGVLAHRPEGRAETARVFGASGAATYFAYARLALCSVVGWAIVLFVLGACTGAVAPRIETALSVGELVVPLVIAFVPALLLLHLFSTVTDYARAELTLRRDSHDPGVVATYVRTLLWVMRRPLTLVHGAFGVLLALLVTLAYAALAHGHPMFGAEGAITLFVARQGVSLVRVVIRVGVMGGQLELARTRPLPPRRVEEPVKPAP